MACGAGRTGVGTNNSTAMIAHKTAPTTVRPCPAFGSAPAAQAVPRSLLAIWVGIEVTEVKPEIGVTTLNRTNPRDRQRESPLKTRMHHPCPGHTDTCRDATACFRTGRRIPGGQQRRTYNLI